MAEDESESRSRDSREQQPVSSGDETARAVRDVLEDQADRKARQKDASRRKKKRLLPLPLVATFWGVACLVVWVATPEFLLPEPLPEPSPARIEAGLRMEMLGLVQEINEFRDETGTVPESLELISEDRSPYLRYTPLPPTSYRLTGARAETEIVYQSGTPVEEFRGNAREVIESRVEADS